jgi:hypothetical protein
MSSSDSNLNDVDFKISLIKVSRCGLIHEIVGTILEYRGGVYTITPLLRRLMDIVKVL